MKIGIFIRTYAGDAHWLDYCLRSIAKFCTGYTGVFVTCPRFDQPTIRKVVSRYRMIPGLLIEPCSMLLDGDRGYMNQQVTKLYADTQVDWDYIAFVDSDCTFIRCNTPNDLFHGELPVLIVTPYAELGDSVPWQPITEKAMGLPCEFETMRREPWIIHRSVLSRLRAYMLANHKMSLHDYVLSQPGRHFSEFNLIGSYVLRAMPHTVHVVDSSKDKLPEVVLKQRWSWSGLTQEERAEMEELLK